MGRGQPSFPAVAPPMELQPSRPHRHPQALPWLLQNLGSFSKILGSHLGPTKGLRMGKFCSNSKDRAKLDDWFRSPALDQLEELTFDDGHLRSLPMSALRLAPTPCVAKFRNCHFPPLNDTPALILPRLKHLELVVLCLSKGDMERLLRGCTAFIFRRSMG